MSAAGPRPQVMFALPRLDAGGPDRVFSALLHGLPADRYRLSLLVQRAGGRYFDRLPSHVEVHVLDSDARYPARAARRALAAARPDIVVSSLRMSLTVELARATLRHAPRQVVRQATPIAADFAALKRQSLVKHRIAERLLRWAWRRADAQVAQSAHMAHELAADAPARQLIRVIGNPVSLAAIDAEADAASSPLAGDPAIIAVGRLSPPKNYPMLLEAMALLGRRLPAAHLTILGAGELHSALAARAAAPDLAGRVTLAGQCDAVAAAVRSADLYVCSSDYEAFSNSVLEALALGVPVVATDCPGAMRELVAHGRTGWLSPPGDAAALAEAMAQALAAGASYVGAAARADVGARFATQRIVDDYAALFDALLASPA